MSSAGQALKGAAVLFSSRWMPFAVYASFILALSLSAIQEVESGADDTQLAQAAAQDDDGVAMGASGGDLTVSMHISDTHVDLGIPERVAKLNEWATSTVPTVDPAFVLHSGDLTEGYATFLGSEQQEPEWRAYKELIALAGLNKTTRYADVRGNHDTAMVNSLDAANNYYRKYGLWGPKIAGTDAERVFQAEFNTSHGMYRAVFVDLAPIPGPTIPFTNGGSADAEMMARLESLLAQPGPWAATLIVSHYPLTYVVQGGDLLDLASKHRVTAILCGHTHNDDMTANRGDLLELEVGDMKRNFIYRVMAFDHGLFAHTDARIGQWPVVLPTNPKSAGYTLVHEPLHRIVHSTHMRALAWSPSGITTVQFRVNGKLACANATQAADQPALFTCPWSPGALAPGLHTLQVDVVDNDGLRASTEHPFSVDGTGAPLSTSFFSLLLRIPFLALQLAGFLLSFAPVWLCAVAGFIVSARALKEQGLSVLGPAPPAVQSEWRQLLMQDRAALRSIVALCSSCRANKKAATHARAKPTAEGEGDYEMGTLPREEAKSDGTESPRPPMAAVLTVGGMGQWAQAALWWFTLRWRHLTYRFAVLPGRWRLLAVAYGACIWIGPMWIAPTFGDEWSVTTLWGSIWHEGYVYSYEFSLWWCAVFSGLIGTLFLLTVSSLAFHGEPNALLPSVLIERVPVAFFLSLFTIGSSFLFINTLTVPGWILSPVGLLHVLCTASLIGAHISRSCARKPRAA